MLVTTMSNEASSKSRLPAPVIQDDGEELHEALSELVRVYQFRDREGICCYDISVTQCYALDALIRRDALTLGEVATQLYLDKSTTSRVLAALVRKGYVRRSSHPTDARAVLLRATPAGRRLHERIHHDLVSEARRLLQGFAPDVRRGAIRLIRALAQAAAGRARGGACGPQECFPQVPVGKP